MVEKNIKEYLFVDGHFQLPIFWGHIHDYRSME